MYDIVLTSRYKKSLRKIEKSGRCRISDIEKVVNVIASGKKFGAKHQDNKFFRALTMPGLWVQRITTKEPTKKQLEVGIAALKRALELEKC